MITFMHILLLVQCTTSQLVLLFHIDKFRHSFFLTCSVYLISGSPNLGAVETIKATLSGATFGLPVSEVPLFLDVTCLQMNAYANSEIWMRGSELAFSSANLCRIVGVLQDVILVPFCYRCLH